MEGPFAIDALPPQPWRNGRGVTRTVAADGDGAGQRWRISLADLSGDAPFSRFDGLERSAVLVAGSGLVLVADGRRCVLSQPGQQLDFGGEAEVAAETPAGPARLWNVMTRRGAARARLLWLTDADAATPQPLPAAQVRVLLAVGAGCRVLAGSQLLRLDAGQCWIVPPGLPPLQAAPDAGGGLLLTCIDTVGG